MIITSPYYNFVTRACIINALQSVNMFHESKKQKTWIDFQLTDLRHVKDDWALDAPVLIESGDSAGEALIILELVFGFIDDSSEIAYITPIGKIKVLRESLPHIVEKRMDARERYANFAIITIQDPFEVWRVSYDSDSGGSFFRLVFIGLFKDKRQILVTVDIREEKILWNFMHQDRKSLNKHRHGELVYSRIGGQ